MARKTEMTKHSLYVLVLTVCFFFIQCDSPHYYQEQKSVGKGWDKDLALTYNFEIKETTASYDFSFVSRNNNDYPYANLYIFTKLVDPKGQEFSDTLQYYLAFQDGEWIGKGNNLKELYLVYRENVSLKDTGMYKLSVWHGMRDEKLIGIEDLSLIVDKNKAQ